MTRITDALTLRVVSWKPPETGVGCFAVCASRGRKIGSLGVGTDGRPAFYDGRNRTFFFFDYQGTRHRRGDSISTRIDHAVSRRYNLFGRFSRNVSELTQPDHFGNDARPEQHRREQRGQRLRELPARLQHRRVRADERRSSAPSTTA